MLEYFSEWAQSSATLHRVITTKNAAGQTVSTVQNIDGVHLFGKWVSKSIQTNQSDKFINYETGKLAIDYKVFTLAGVAVEPMINWYAMIDGKKYFIDGIDDVGSLHEAYIFDYHKDR